MIGRLLNHSALMYAFPSRYLNDLDCEQQYQSLGVAPLPMHGQVRPVKVEPPTWHSPDTNEDNGGHHGNSSPPSILRRRARKRDADVSTDRLEVCAFGYILLVACLDCLEQMRFDCLERMRQD